MTGNWALTSIVAFGLIGCGGAPPAPAKAPTHEDTEPRTIDEAQDQIDSARAAIDQNLAQGSPAVNAEKAPNGGPASEEKPSETCGGQCKALASMKRAVGVLCRLTGDNEGRCVSAKRTLDASTIRVASCKCSR